MLPDLERLFDVALYGHVRGAWDPAGAVQPLGPALERIASTGPGPDVRLLRIILNHLRPGGEESNGVSARTCSKASRLALARAVAAGVPIDGRRLDAVAIARDCSLHLDRCYYVSAARELTILAAIPARIAETKFGPEIRRFIAQAWGYLEVLSAVVDSPRLEWECDLYRCANGTSP